MPTSSPKRDNSVRDAQRRVASPLPDLNESTGNGRASGKAPDSAEQETSATQELTEIAEDAAEAMGPWICRLARVGYASKGLVYLVVGALSALAAAGAGGSTTDGRGAMSAILLQPFGRIVVSACIAGLLGYALWRLIAAWRDTEHRGSTAKGYALRAGQAGSGIIAIVLAGQAWRVLDGDIGESRAAREWTIRFLEAPAGRWIVGLGGVLVAGYALFQFYKASGNVNKHLRLWRIDDRWHGLIEKMSRFGLAARGLVFLIIGWFIVVAAVKFSGQTARGIDGALNTLQRQPYGPAMLGIVAFGLIAYGLMQIVNARWRRVEVD